MRRLKQIKIPGKQVGMSVPVVPVAAPVAVASACTPSVEGLYWFRDGVYSETLQTALFFGDGAINPKLTTARLLGELCDQDVAWSAIWENADGGDDGAPLVYPVGADLDVVAALDTKEGLLTVRAEVDGVGYGPIDLVLFQGCSGGTYYGYSACSLNFTSFYQAFELVSMSGTFDWGSPIVAHSNYLLMVIEPKLAICDKWFLRVLSESAFSIDFVDGNGAYHTHNYSGTSPVIYEFDAKIQRINIYNYSSSFYVVDLQVATQ